MTLLADVVRTSTQVAGTSSRLAKTRLVRIVSSPLERCVETAQPIADLLGLEIQVHAGVGEVFDTFHRQSRQRSLRPDASLES